MTLCMIVMFVLGFLFFGILSMSIEYVLNKIEARKKAQTHFKETERFRRGIY